MAYFQKACVLMSLEHFEEALADLKRVRCLAPKEACVHFQLGRVYTKLQRDKKALLHFNIARDLNRDSKDYHTIKTHIERLHIRGVKDAAESTEGGAAAGAGGGGGGPRRPVTAEVPPLRTRTCQRSRRLTCWHQAGCQAHHKLVAAPPPSSACCSTQPAVLVEADTCSSSSSS